jgi:pimeloyl-ACP methyl ester carboxylesterase
VTDHRVLVLAGLAVYRRPHASGQRVVLVHGAMDRAAAFARACRHLRDLDVVRYDRRGYARSLGAGIAATIGELVDDLLAVIGDVPAVVVGHSLGGVVAMAAAGQRPELVRSVGAFEPPMPWVAWWPAQTAGDAARRAAGESPAAAAEAFMRRMIGDRRWLALPEATRAQRRAEGPALIADLAALRLADAPFDGAGLEPPLVLGRGEQTDERHRRAVTELAAAVPDAEVTVISGAPHGAHYSHGEEFAGFVRRAVARAT